MIYAEFRSYRIALHVNKWIFALILFAWPDYLHGRNVFTWRISTESALNRHFIGRAVQRKTDKAIIKQAMLLIRMNRVAFFL